MNNKHLLVTTAATHQGKHASDYKAITSATVYNKFDSFVGRISLQEINNWQGKPEDSEEQVLINISFRTGHEWSGTFEELDKVLTAGKVN